MWLHDFLCHRTIKSTSLIQRPSFELLTVCSNFGNMFITPHVSRLKTVSIVDFVDRESKRTYITYMVLWVHDQSSPIGKDCARYVCTYKARMGSHTYVPTLCNGYIPKMHEDTSHNTLFSHTMTSKLINNGNFLHGK